MSKTYTDGSQQHYSRLARIMRQYHHELADASARISLTFVRAFDKEDEPEPALKFAGGYCAGKAKLVSQERRLRIPFEGEIFIDGMTWDELPDRQQDSLLDHELSHFKVVTDAHGAVQVDDQDHVKLKLVPDDIILTGFLSVIRHWGEDANEYRSISNAMEAAASALAEMVQEQPEETVAA